MLRKLRRKIIIINMVFVNVVLLLAMVIIAYSTYATTWDGVFHEMTLLADQSLSELFYQSEEEPSDSLERLSHVPYVSILIRNNDSRMIISSDGTYFTDDELNAAIDQAVDREEKQGALDKPDLAFYKAPSPWGQILLLRDVTIARRSMQSSLITSIALFFVSSGLCLLISLFLSSMAVKPISEALEQQNQFIANASHDLKTPLTVLLANTNIMASHPTETVAQQRKWLDSMTEEGDKMHRLIDAMLSLAKVDNNQAPVELVPLNISDLVEEELLFLEPVAYEKEVELNIQVQKDVTWNSDRALLQKLVALLVDNAIKYSEPGSAVTITLRENKNLYFSVQNYGVPIPEEDLEHLFERFYRSDKSRTTNGYGLGLAIAKTTSRKLHGSISAASNARDGTTFTVEFKPSKL